MKIIALLLLSLLITLPLASCGDNADASAGSTPAATTPTLQTTTKSTTSKVDPVVPIEPAGPKEFKVGTAEQLAAAIRAINDMDASEDSNITLTDDIDLTGYADTSTWEPIYRYEGTFDGAGHTIKNLNWSFTMANSGDSDMPSASMDFSYVLQNMEGDLVGNRYACATVSLLILQLNGGTVKDLTFTDSSLNIICSYNKNYQMYFGSVVGFVNGGTVSGIKMNNVDITIPAEVNYNQAFAGYAAPLIGKVEGTASVSDCTVDAACLVDTSANVKFNTGKLIGIMEDVDGSLTVENCTSEAETKVHPAPTTDPLMYKGNDTVLGGVAGDLVGEDLS